MQWLALGLGAIIVMAAVIAILAVALNDGIPGPGDPLDDAGHALGSADAPVAFVVFSDFQCPFCRQFALDGLERQIIDEYVDSRQVRFVYRHLIILGDVSEARIDDESVRAAEASECAASQGMFWEYHDYLFNNRAGENVGAFSNANLIRFANELRLDVPAFTDCMESRRFLDRVREDTNAAYSADIRSTPTILINGRRVNGVQDYETYEEVIEEELIKAR
jgi:protein-disulfide isomerase